MLDSIIYVEFLGIAITESKQALLRGTFDSLEILRKLAVLFPSTMDRDFRIYTMGRIDSIDPKDLERLLYPLLTADDRPTAPEMLKAVSPLLNTVLDHEREATYLEAMAAGKYRPGLPEIVERIRQHPALLWKTENVA